MRGRPGFEPGSLLRIVKAASARALAAGVLYPIPTECEFVEDGGVRFFVRVLTSLARKDEERMQREHRTASGKAQNPFLPYEPVLYVADVSKTHVAILNKFNVLDHHLLIVTREYEDQRSLLTLRDFEAWWRCLQEYEGLGFYNGGVEAGASQSHKHLQLVPLPLAPQGPPLPIAPLLPKTGSGGELTTIPGFDFLHSFARFKGTEGKNGLSGVQEAYGCYGAMLGRVGLRPPEGNGLELQSGPYCLLVTGDWMLLVPRSREFFASISINALGFAGALLVRDEAQLRALIKAGPFTALRETAFPKRAPSFPQGI